MQVLTPRNPGEQTVGGRPCRADGAGGAGPRPASPPRLGRRAAPCGRPPRPSRAPHGARRPLALGLPPSPPAKGIICPQGALPVLLVASLSATLGLPSALTCNPPLFALGPILCMARQNSQHETCSQVLPALSSIMARAKCVGGWGGEVPQCPKTRHCRFFPQKCQLAGPLTCCAKSCPCHTYYGMGHSLLRALVSLDGIRTSAKCPLRTFPPPPWPLTHDCYLDCSLPGTWGISGCTDWLWFVSFCFQRSQPPHKSTPYLSISVALQRCISLEGGYNWAESQTPGTNNVCVFQCS